MDAQQLLSALASRNVRLRVTAEGDLRCRAPRGEMTDELRAALREHKAAVVESLGCRQLEAPGPNQNSRECGPDSSARPVAIPNVQTAVDLDDTAWLRQLIQTGEADRLEPFHLRRWILLVHPGRFARSILLDLKTGSYRARTGLAARDLARFREVIENRAETTSPPGPRIPAATQNHTHSPEEV